MGHKDKQQKIYADINELFNQILELKDSQALKNFLVFLQRVPTHAPFNTALVFAQNPECRYYATAKQWKEKFNKKIKQDARPMVILAPFSPVDFVYDIKDTEGDQNIDEQLLYWWQEQEGKFDEKVIEKTIKNCLKLNIKIKYLSRKEYSSDKNFNAFGYAKNDRQEKSIVLSHRYNDKKFLSEEYGTLCHEIAHHLLGHLGEIRISSKDPKKSKKVAPDKQDKPRDIKELEAELTAWIVFSFWKVEKRSAGYMADWLIDKNNLKKIDMSLILTVAGRIKAMGE